MSVIDAEFLKNSVIVVAHPDDEILWFSSIMQDVSQVIIAYEDCWAEPDLGAKRAAAVAELPHKNAISLKIDEAGTYGCANWKKPELSEHGIAFSHGTIKRELKRSVINALPFINKPTAPKSVSDMYAENYHILYDLLDQKLDAGMNVFTHNPWGEYGHEDHLQVFRAVDKLRVKKGFTQWMSNYVTDRTLPLAMTYFSDKLTHYQRLQTDKVYAEDVTNIYRKHDCWTWRNDWVGFDDECFMEAPKSQVNAGPQSHLCPLNLFSI